MHESEKSGCLDLISIPIFFVGVTVILFDVVQISNQDLEESIKVLLFLGGMVLIFLSVPGLLELAANED